MFYRSVLEMVGLIIIKLNRRGVCYKNNNPILLSGYCNPLKDSFHNGIILIVISFKMYFKYKFY